MLGFVEAAAHAQRLVRDSLAGLAALSTVFRPPIAAERRAFAERRQRMAAQQRAYEAERLRRNPRLRYRSRRPLWLRLQSPLRRRQRPPSLLRELAEGYDDSP